MFRRTWIVLALVAAAFFGAVSPARAELFFVTASEGELEAPGERLYGVAADSWVLFDSHQVYSLHLSSLYVWLDDDDYVEAGWAWYAGDGPEAFIAFEREGHTTEQERIWLGPVQPGTWLHIEIANVSGETSGPVLWECRVGDKTAAVYQDFTRGTLRASSERQTYRDSGYALFREMRAYDAASRWAPWRRLRIQNGDQDYEGFRVGRDGYEVR